ncbi:MAG: hypothetical protein R3D02_03970 [Hyphomicrobiales bacterium]
MTQPETMAPSPALQNAPVLLVTRNDAEQVCGRIVETMEKLQAVIVEETRLLKAAKIASASELAVLKAELARQYAADMKFAKEQQQALSKLAPVWVDRIRRLHETFRAELQMNLAVLATAKAVSEGLVRGVSEQVNNRNRPQTYGQHGRMQAAPSPVRRGLTVNQSL